MKREIQAVADAHGIEFKQAAKSVCESLERAYGDKDVIFRYRDGDIKGMRKINDSGLDACLTNVLNERLEQWKK